MLQLNKIQIYVYPPTSEDNAGKRMKQSLGMFNKRTVLKIKLC